MHNGALKSLKEVVRFYNTRDVPAALSLIDVGTEMNSDRPSPDQAARRQPHSWR